MKIQKKKLIKNKKQQFIIIINFRRVFIVSYMFALV